jgi:hypothetical protein
MTVRRAPEAIIRAVLADGPSELPERAYESVAEAIRGTRQRRVLGRVGETTLFRFGRFGLAAAAVVIVAVVMADVIPRWSAIGTSEPGHVVSMPLPYEGPLAAGTYHAAPAAQAVSFTVPAGWEVSGGPWVRQSGHEATVDVGFMAAEAVYADPCAHVVATPKPGRSVDDLAAALQTIPGVAATAPRPAAIGGRMGQYLELRLPRELGCESHEYWMFGLPATGSLYWPSSPGETARVWIIGTQDDQRLVIVASNPASAAQADLDEQTQVIESIRIG